MTKRDLKVGDIVRTEHGGAYCVVSMYTSGANLSDSYVIALNRHGIIRSIHVDSIVRIIEHTDLIDKVYEKLEKKE